MSGFVIGAPVAFLFAGGFGAAYWVTLKLVESEPDLKRSQRNTWQVVILGGVGVIVLLTIGMGGL